MTARERAVELLADERDRHNPVRMREVLEAWVRETEPPKLRPLRETMSEIHEILGDDPGAYMAEIVRRATARATATCAECDGSGYAR